MGKKGTLQLYILTMPAHISRQRNMATEINQSGVCFFFDTSYPLSFSINNFIFSLNFIFLIFKLKCHAMSSESHHKKRKKKRKTLLKCVFILLFVLKEFRQHVNASKYISIAFYRPSQNIFLNLEQIIFSISPKYNKNERERKKDHFGAVQLGVYVKLNGAYKISRSNKIPICGVHSQNLDSTEMTHLKIWMGWPTKKKLLHFCHVIERSKCFHFAYSH